jgi:hypothetical protein
MPESNLRRTVLRRAMEPWLSLLLLLPALLAGDPAEYRRRVDTVRHTPGFVVLWDFVLRSERRFDAYQPSGSSHDYRLDAVNYVRDYWNLGRPASYDDFPLLGSGPFGDAVRFRNETDPDFRPVLLIPRGRLHNTPLDVKGPGQSVSMVVWLNHESGNHALAGIWHEGTDLHSENAPVARVEKGRRQYALFAGLAANNGAAAVHVSENGGASFGDRYARNLAVTPERIPSDTWSAAGLTYDNARHVVTAYLNGKASDYWIEHPDTHPFFRWPASGWLQAQLHRQPGLQPGEDPNFPAAQFYEPPEAKPLRRERVSQTADRRTEIHHFVYTRVQVSLEKDGQGRFRRVVERKLVALRANPFWFAHDLYAPARVEDGGPFTIGRVIHTSRSVGFTGAIGGVAVFRRALTAAEMRRLAAIAALPPLSR